MLAREDCTVAGRKVRITNSFRCSWLLVEGIFFAMRMMNVHCRRVYRMATLWEIDSLLLTMLDALGSRKACLGPGTQSILLEAGPGRFLHETLCEKA